VLTTLNKNIEKAGFIKDSKVIRANAFKIGAPPGPGGRKYDLIFVDPPYADTENVGIDSRLGNLLDILAGQIDAGGFVVVRTRRTIELPDQYGPLKVIERREWGTMAITILQLESNG
jgi:16S rRNA G966 N2-methylase RsmD